MVKQIYESARLEAIRVSHYKAGKIKILTFVKYDSTNISAVILSGSSMLAGKMSRGNSPMRSTIRCRLGSSVKRVGPIEAETKVLMSCRYDRVDESPMYSREYSGQRGFKDQ